jgi:hypothetical protein
MAGKSARKSTSGKQGPTIAGAVRFGGKVFTAGQEEELQDAMDEAGVEEVRGFGVDSTDVSLRGVSSRSSARRAEIEDRRAQARQELANGGASKGGKSGKVAAEDVPDLTGVTLAELPSALEGINDKKILQAAKRRDPRAGAKPLYAARLEAINSAPTAGDGGTDGEDDVEDGDEG